MTEMTMYEAVRALVAPLDSSAIISDGANDWTPAGLIDALEGDEEVLDLAVVPGETVRRINADGYIETGEPVERVRAKASVTISEVEEWVEEHILEALAAVREVVTSPLVSTRLCYDGREYWVYRDVDEIPGSVAETLRGVSLILAEWVSDSPISPEEVERYEDAIRRIEAILPSDPTRDY